MVTRYKLAENGEAVGVEIFIRAPYDKLVKKDTRFWNISGVEVDVGAEGVKVDMAVGRYADRRWCRFF